jgi:hypothetical protein
MLASYARRKKRGQGFLHLLPETCRDIPLDEF